MSERNIEDIKFDLESLEESVRRSAIFECARMGDKALPVIPILQRMSGSDPSIEIRFICRKTLSALAMSAGSAAPGPRVRKSAGLTMELSKSSPQMVILQLSSLDANLRASAYRACALRREPELLPALLAKVGPEAEPDVELRAMLVRVLAIVGGREALKAVGSFLHDPDARVRANCVETLASYQELPAYALIAKSLTDEDHRVVVAAVSALQAVGAINILRICSAMMKASAYWSRDAAAYLLGSANLPEALPLLVHGLQDSYESVRIKCQAGIKKLADQGHEPAREALSKVSGIPSVEQPMDFLRLENETPRGVTSIQEKFSNPDLEERRAFTKQAASLGMVDEGYIPTMLQALADEKDEQVQENLVVALGAMKKPVIIPHIQPLVSSPSTSVRMAVADALGAIGTTEALIAAAPLLKDRSLSVAGRAILALRSQPSLGITARLKEMASENSKAKQLVCMLIGELNEARYAGILEGLLGDADPEVAALAKETAAALPVGSSASYESTDRPHPVTDEFIKPEPEAPVRPLIGRLHAILKRELTSGETTKLDSVGATDGELMATIDALEAKKTSFYSVDQVIWEFEAGQRAKASKPATDLPAGASGKARQKTRDCKKCNGTGYLLSNQSVKPCDCKR